jgi:phage terminase small subunit
MSTTPKEQKFAELYVTLGNASEAYRQAYNVTTTNLDTIKAKASKLLAKDNISTTIDKLKGELSTTHGIDRAFILQGYLQIISDADYTFQLGADNTLTKEDKQAFYRIMNQTKNTDKIRALEAISKMMGLNEPEVIEHKHTVKTYKTNWG